jgi:hypothetical protein
MLTNSRSHPSIEKVIDIIVLVGALREAGVGPFATFRNVRARSVIRGEVDSFYSLRP